MCQCNSVGIDDDRILGTEYDDRSIYATTINGKTIWLPNLKDLQFYIQMRVEQMKKIQEEEIFTKKNADYGDAFAKYGQEFSCVLKTNSKDL